ncbi:hypothetical protein GLYMA_14G015900v4 [Glycine max]|uniref:Viral late gene transcription factor 3 zinc ribbon domain-containing protein n=2 Tax=Glycine subgen. Soja TaxID=1462606 RepID=K7M4E1_SOYBN|nr:uncharacterized protein LOC100777123 isoform X2 [Glycine max]XP_028201130.1 uncharacterized protein LOC114385309 isoform X2 [Glycine soja]KAH1092665.1 hypothetical protein GYH30_038731 [Glycine max]KRH14273.1 hypothetical protein GLYMA_14G015900v4 [Glycine max]RZB66965.1 hypothetical protein D0Y65_037391 [Glycine soja]RZB66966.1 hypothetical protein D0Y65_037391 [Glycine soja]|eukprot:XP_006595702.1 uncharacterized protein LOC100777123 isoform X2 [Glycine max]
MEAAAASSSLSLLSLASVKTRSKVAQNCHVTQQRQRCNHVCVKNARRTRVTAVPVNVDDVTTVLDPAPVEVTWQIVVGAIAGVTPFVVAGIEFSKRIIAQKRCEVCGGSGLVLREKEKDYLRCPECVSFILVMRSYDKCMTANSSVSLVIPLQQCN